MAERYFRRVAALTPTKFWINNPTRDEARWAIAEGALGCTNNPSYPQKMVDHPEEGAYASQILDDVLAEVADDDEALIEHQARLVKPIADIFRPMYRRERRPARLRQHPGRPDPRRGHRADHPAVAGQP